jgi:membrane protein DedA with SNARE-associated domain
MATLSRQLNENAILFSIIIAFSPVPYTLFALAAGTLKINILAFIIGSILGRTVRYGMIAYPAYLFGEKAVEVAKRNRLLVASVVVMLLLVYVGLVLRHVQ